MIRGMALLGVSLMLFGIGCLRSRGDDVARDWQTYEDVANGFSLKYPGVVPGHDSGAAISLPDATGHKERTMTIKVVDPKTVNLDAKGCQETGARPVAKENERINGVSFCRAVTDEGAAGSTYRTYEYVTRRDKIIVIDFTIRFPTSVRIYAGCERDEDQGKQTCKDLAFDEARDATLFPQIMRTFQLLR